MIEIRWHGRAGQGAKTASQLLAAAAMATGKQVQAFPDYGPERSGAPMRAYTRIDDAVIRRRYGITEPDVVVVLDDSLLHETKPAEGLREGGLLVVNTEQELEGAICVPAGRLATKGYVNAVMLGAAAAALGEPPRAAVLAAAETKGFDAAEIEAGYRAVEELRCAA